MDQAYCVHTHSIYIYSIHKYTIHISWDNFPRIYFSLVYCQSILIAVKEDDEVVMPLFLGTHVHFVQFYSWKAYTFFFPSENGFRGNVSTWQMFNHIVCRIRNFMMLHILQYIQTNLWCANCWACKFPWNHINFARKIGNVERANGKAKSRYTAKTVHTSTIIRKNCEQSPSIGNL